VAPKVLTDVTTLSNVPVDGILESIDDEASRLPSPDELYRRWERQHWTVQELDLSTDRAQWLAMDPDNQRRRLRSFIGFLHGEVAVTDTLAPYVMAVPRQDQRLFLTTQIVDEARHAVFFRRYLTEVVGIENDSLEALLDETKSWLGPTFNQIFDVELIETSQRILHERSLTALTEGVVLYHLLIENMLALSAQRSMLNQYRAADLLPGFRAGFIAVTRDESRHVLFGLGFLRDAMRADPAQRDVIVSYLDRMAPLFIESCTVPEELRPTMLKLGLDPEERLRYAKHSLRKKLHILGLPVPAPAA